MFDIEVVVLAPTAAATVRGFVHNRTVHMKLESAEAEMAKLQQHLKDGTCASLIIYLRNQEYKRDEILIPQKMLQECPIRLMIIDTDFKRPYIPAGRPGVPKPN